MSLSQRIRIYISISAGGCNMCGNNITFKSSYTTAYLNNIIRRSSYKVANFNSI